MITATEFGNFPLAAGTYEYKFAYDNWTGQEELAPGSSCTLTTGQFTNRLINVSSDMVLDVVCWESCSSCDNPQGPFNVTFQVDMSQVTATYTTPEVNGTFNNWCGGCAPMTDANGDDIWELTISLPADTFEYKFAYDSWAGQESLTPGSVCTQTTGNFTNRKIIVTGAETLPVVCWESCEACIIGINEVAAAQAFVLFPNPATDNVQLSFGNNIKGSAMLRVMDARGAVVYTAQVSGTNRTTINTQSFGDGLYFVQVIGEGLNATESFIVQK
jgi:hypothetical protein